MSKKHLMLSESSLDGPRTRLDVVMAAECPALKAHHIAHVGIVDAFDQYQRVRTRPDGSFLLACFAGEGRILLDGRWQVCRAGTICLAPPNVPDAFHAVKGKRWAFAYVRYHEPAAQKPVVNAASPVRVKSEPEVLQLAVRGLYLEMNGARDPRLMHHWAELIHGWALRVAQPWQVNARLWHLWESVGKELAAEWTLGKLAALAHFSTEHLRRLCLRELGRSPMQQLTYMRMQRAAGLLEVNDDKLDVIAEQVGYSGALALSKTFKKWIGSSPSEFRGNGRR
jgi:AraC-like DNA-binding protein